MNSHQHTFKVKVAKKNILYYLKKIIGVPLIAMIVLINLTLLAGTLYVNKVIESTPTVTKESLSANPSTNLYDKKQNIIWSSADNQRIYVTYDELPEQFINAVIAVEDQDFKTNTGYSLKGIANAIKSYIESKFTDKTARGGSTIEQQLIKLSVFSTKEEDRTIERKIKELFLAKQLHENYSKEEIFELYINKIYMGQNVYGAQTIAKTYYDKPLNELTLAQLATLAGVIQAPSHYDLYEYPNDTRERRNTVLRLMKEQSYISQDEYNDAISEPIDNGLKEKDWLKATKDEIALKYASFIESALNEVKALGYDITITPLQIYTTLDPTVQDELNNIWNNESDYFYKDSQSAITVANTQNGKIIAQIGGRNINELFGFNRATNTNRSSGSTIKPFLVASAFQNLGWSQAQELSALNYQYPDSDIIAKNYEGIELDKVTIYEALKQSLNTPMLRVLESLNLNQYKQTLTDFGFNANELYLSNALGINASTEQLATAYATFANNGVYNPASYIDKIVFSDNSERIIQPPNRKIIESGVAYMIYDILKAIPQQEGPFKDAYIENEDYGAKTGTVAYENTEIDDKSAMDIWTVLTSKGFSFAIWHGFDEPLAENGQLNETDLKTKKANLLKKVFEITQKAIDNQTVEKPETVEENESGFLTYKIDHDNIKAPILSQIANELIPFYLNENEQHYTNQSVNNLNVIPKDYQIGQWQTVLQHEMETFNDRVKEIKEENKQKLEKIKREQLINQNWNNRRFERPTLEEQKPEEESGENND